MNNYDVNYRDLIEKAAQRGFENEHKYTGCSQAVVAALIESFGFGSPDILRASSALAGGIARRGNVCGALNGGLMMIGLLVGRDDLEMIEQYQRGMSYADKLYRRFEEKVGTALCAEIQIKKFGKRYDMLTQEGRDEFHNAGAHDPEGCALVVREGARLAAELIVEIINEGRPMAQLIAKR